MINLLFELFLVSEKRTLPKNSIIVIIVFSLLIVLTIVLGILLVRKNKKEAKEAEIINQKKNSDLEE